MASCLALPDRSHGDSKFARGRTEMMQSVPLDRTVVAPLLDAALNFPTRNSRRLIEAFSLKQPLLTDEVRFGRK